jgi:hypothetical protein
VAEKSTGGEVANALVCKTSIRGFNSRPVLQQIRQPQQITLLLIASGITARYLRCCGNSGKCVGHNLLGFIHNAFEMGFVPEAFGIDLVQVLCS